MDREFVWLSPLGIGVAFFLVWGALNVFLGILVPFVVGRFPTEILVISPRSDAVVFDAPTKDILAREPSFDLFRSLTWHWFAGPLAAFGASAIAIAWFALRAGETWALVVLTIAWAATLISAGLVLSRYIQSGAPLGLGDIPPLFTVAASAGTLGVLLSWIGLGQRAG